MADVHGGAHPGAGDGDGAPRVAVLVLNPFHNDARVGRCAQALSDAGADVRIFALGTARYPPGRSMVDGVQVHRLATASVTSRAALLVHALRRRCSAPRHPEVGGVPGLARVQHVQQPRRGRALVVAALGTSVAVLRRLLLPTHRTLTTLQYTRAAVREVKAFGPDVVHAHDLNTLLAAHLSRGGNGPDAARLVYDSHELWRYRNRHGELRPVARLVERVAEGWLAPRADAVITVSPSIARWLRSRYELRSPVTVVRNVPARRTTVPDRASLQAPDGAKVVVYTGRLMPGRGLENAVRALARLPDDVVLRAVGYGDPEYRRALLSLAHEEGVADRVRLVPAVEPGRVTSVAAAADVALVAIEPICLSYRYALPNKLFEAAQAGVPALVSDLPDMAALVRRHHLGLTLPTGDPDTVAAAVKEVLAAPCAYTPPQEAAEVLCWEQEALHLLSCYAGLGVALRDDQRAGASDGHRAPAPDDVRRGPADAAHPAHVVDEHRPSAGAA